MGDPDPRGDGGSQPCRRYGPGGGGGGAPTCLGCHEAAACAQRCPVRGPHFPAPKTLGSPSLITDTGMLWDPKSPALAGFRAPPFPAPAGFVVPNFPALPLFF